jgi:hypothetical protein
MSRLNEKVGAGCNRNPISTMTATGVPPHLVLANSVAKLQRKMVCMKEDIIDKLEHLPEALKQSMLEDFQIEGTVPITRHEMQEMMIQHFRIRYMGTLDRIETSPALAHISPKYRTFQSHPFNTHIMNFLLT